MRPTKTAAGSSYNPIRCTVPLWLAPLNSRHPASSRSYQPALRLTHAGDSGWGWPAIPCCKLWEVCDGCGGWVSGGFFRVGFAGIGATERGCGSGAQAFGCGGDFRWRQAALVAGVELQTVRAFGFAVQRTWPGAADLRQGSRQAALVEPGAAPGAGRDRASGSDAGFAWHGALAARSGGSPIIAATPGTTSSSNHPASPPSDCANGSMGDDQ